MTGDKDDLVRYRLEKAKETLEDAHLLIESKRWNSAINRLYYSAFYATIALLLNENYKTTTHNGVKSIFSEQFIKKNLFRKNLGKSILNYSRGDKKVITLTYLTLLKKRFYLTMTLLEIHSTNRKNHKRLIDCH
jgi:uncharacterized protein (UPF0332 family)